MSLQYTHLLIPENVDFAPEPEHVAAFLERLIGISSAPIDATVKVGKLSGNVRTGTDPLTGARISIPRREFVNVQGVSEIVGHIAGLNDYDAVISGSGPAEVPPFKLYSITDSGESEFGETYGYDVYCHLRKGVVSTCETPAFGSPCQPTRVSGIFRHPNTGEAIEVPNAACARFWIGFQFGKWLFPKIENNLKLLEPKILATATEELGVRFAQGCICE
jgi:hypothetical protein